MSQFTVERVPLTEVCEFDESSPIDDRIVAESMLLALIPGEHPLRNRSYNVLATNFKKHLSGPSRCTNQRGGIAKMGVNLVVYRKIVVVAGIIDTGSAGGVSHWRHPTPHKKTRRADRDSVMRLGIPGKTREDQVGEFVTTTVRPLHTLLMPT